MKGWLLVAGLWALFALPLAAVAVQALAPGWRWAEPWPRVFSWRALEFLWTQREALLLQILSSTGYSLAAAALSLLLCLAPARLLARREFSGKALVEALLLAPALAPVMTFALGAQVLLLWAGLADSVAGLVLMLTMFSYPYMLRALVTGMQVQGEDLSLCARNLGAGLWTRWWRVELPLLRPAIMAGGTVVFLVAYSEYYLVHLVGGDVPSLATHAFPYLASSDRGLAAVLTLLFLAPPLALLGLSTLPERLFRRRR